MKLRERIVICFSVTFVLFTLLLVIDYQFDVGYSTQRLFLPLRHGRVYVGDTEPDGEKSVFKSFQDRLVVDKTGGTSKGSSSINGTRNAVHDSFSDLSVFAFPLDKTSILRTNPVVIYVFEDRNAAPTLADLIPMSFGT